MRKDAVDYNNNKIETLQDVLNAVQNGTEYLRAADIVRLTGVSIRTVRRWIDDEIIPSVKLGGTRLVPRAELGRLLSALPKTIEDDMDDADE
jgi:excisionase family DNA binding protein